MHSSQPTSVKETTGRASDVEDTTPHQPVDFTVLIIGAGGGRMFDSTLTTVSRFVTDAINYGGTVTLETITKSTWRNVWGNKDLRSLPSEHSSTVNETTN